MDSIRTFISVPVGEPAYSVLARWIQRLSARISHVRWSHLEQLHLTVKFLGDVDSRDLPRICEILRESCKSLEPFSVTVSGIGTFPKGKPPRVIWAGIEAGGEMLEALHNLLDESLREVGVPRESRRFSPHLTLGRIGRGADRDGLPALLEEAQPLAQTRFEVDEVYLMASSRQRNQVIHEPIDVVEL